MLCIAGTMPSQDENDCLLRMCRKQKQDQIHFSKNQIVQQFDICSDSFPLETAFK